MIDLSNRNLVDAPQPTPDLTSSQAREQIPDEVLQAIACHRERQDWETLALSQWFGEPGGPDDDPEYQAQLASLPDIRDTR